jgi:hypothetical protein
MRVSQNDSLEEFSSEDDKKAHKRTTVGESSVSPLPPKRSLDKSLMDDSSGDDESGSTGRGNRSTKARSSSSSSGRTNEIPHNPIALMNQQRTLPVANSDSPPNEACLWSDSENEEESQASSKKKKKTTNKRKQPKTKDSSPRKKSKETVLDVHDHSVIEDEETRHLLTQDEETLQRTLKPELEYPFFGPFAMEPLVLEGDNGQRNEVPASLNRYLADFQKEGVQFLYKCLTAKTGAILGDEMVRIKIQ